MQPHSRARDSVETRFDIVIAGAGPAGLCLAAALARRGFRGPYIDPQSPGNLSDPAFEGREIALTQACVNALVSPYTPTDLPARPVRGALFGLGSEVRPFKRAPATFPTRARVLQQ